MPDSSNPLDSWSSLWFAGLIDGDSEAIERLWNTYFHRMVRLAKTRLPSGRRAPRDEEDIALSAFKSFCMGLRKGKFADSSNSPNLWPLLVALTLNKARDQIRSDNRKKRGGAGVTGKCRSPIDPVANLNEIAAFSPPPDIEVAAKETLQHLLNRLCTSGDEQLSLIALASMEGNTSQDTADELGCSVRTVQRKLKTIRAIWEQHIE